VPNPDEMKARMDAAIPLQRFGKPAEVAEMCVYLSVGRVRFRHRRRDSRSTAG
jgi:NAD(P)-dependent dehydrogenase (short-subunit alcohol dehydrogenase family)